MRQLEGQKISFAEPKRLRGPLASVHIQGRRASPTRRLASWVSTFGRRLSFSKGITSGVTMTRWQPPSLSEADLEDLTVVAHEPSGIRIRKSDRPIAAHLG